MPGLPTHPGGILGPAEIAVLRDRFASQEEPFKAWFAGLLAGAPLDYTPSAVGVYDVDFNSKGVGAQEFAADCHMCYMQTLAYLATDDARHARVAVRIIEDWSTKVTKFVGRNATLEAAWHAPNLIRCAELLEYSFVGWTELHMYRFNRFVKNHLWFHLTRECPPDKPALATFAALEMQMDFAVLSNDPALFKSCVDKVRAYVPHYLLPAGDNLDTRDRHFLGGCWGLGSIIHCCEIAHQQGVDLYGVLREPLVRCLEAHARLVNGGTVEGIGYPPKWKGYYPVSWEMALNHYVGRAGMQLPEVERLTSSKRPEPYDKHWGLTSLTHWGTAAAQRKRAVPSVAAVTELLGALKVDPAKLPHPQIFKGKWEQQAASDAATERDATKAKGMAANTARSALVQLLPPDLRSVGNLVASKVVPKAINKAVSSDEGPKVHIGPSGLFHPGTCMGPVELWLLKARMEQQLEPWQSWLAQLQSCTPRNWVPRAVPVVNKDWDNTGTGHDQMVNKDGTQMYQQALCYYMTGDEVYANNCVAIVKAWSAKNKEITKRNAPLEAGWALASFARACELLKYTWPGWNDDVEKAFKDWVNNVVLKAIRKITWETNNWHLTISEALLSWAIFNDDRTAVEAELAQFDKMFNTYILQSGECRETSRDLLHSQFGLGGICQIMEIAWHQGYDLYTPYAEKLAKCLELHAQIVNDGKHPAIRYPLLSTDFHPAGWEMAYNHLAHRAGVAQMPQTQKLLDNVRPDKYAFHWGLGSLTHFDTGSYVNRHRVLAASVPSKS